MAVADFNGDGFDDVAVVDYDSAIVTHLSGLGDGVFKAAGTTTTTAHCANYGLGDFNGDGRPDLVLANTNGGSPAVTDVLLGQ